MFSAATLQALYFFILAHQTDFDVVLVLGNRRVK